MDKEVDTMYEEIIKDRIQMHKEITLSDKEKGDALKENQDAGWGFTKEDLNAMLNMHRDAAKAMAYIEYRLTDCNFHTFNSLLKGYEYKEAAEWIKSEMEDD